MVKNKEELGKLRKDIDLIDNNIVILIGKRFSIADKIGKIKKNHHLKIEDRKRENQVLTKVKKSIQGLKRKKAIYYIYKEIIRQTKNVEK
jgi:shikimate dehydrogenase